MHVMHSAEALSVNRTTCHNTHITALDLHVSCSFEARTHFLVSPFLNNTRRLSVVCLSPRHCHWISSSSGSITSSWNSYVQRCSRRIPLAATLCRFESRSNHYIDLKYHYSLASEQEKKDATQMLECSLENLMLSFTLLTYEELFISLSTDDIRHWHATSAAVWRVQHWNYRRPAHAHIPLEFELSQPEGVREVRGYVCFDCVYVCEVCECMCAHHVCACLCCIVCVVCMYDYHIAVPLKGLARVWVCVCACGGWCVHSCARSVYSCVAVVCLWGNNLIEI